MATTSNTPGVYIEEVSRGARPIEGVGTSILGIVGFTGASRFEGESDVHTPVPVSSWTDFTRKFGVPVDKAGRPTTLDKAVDLDPYFEDTYLAHALHGYFMNGGSRAYVVRVPLRVREAEGTEASRKGRARSSEGDLPAEIAPVSSRPQWAKLSVDAFIGKEANRTGILGLAVAEEVTMVCCPDVMWAYKEGLISESDVVAIQKALILHCENRKDRVALVDAPVGLSPDAVLAWRNREDVNFDSKYAALYYPWLRVSNVKKQEDDADSLLVPPCGHVAGVWARTDGDRGVHKAPANEEVRAILKPEMQITPTEQDPLNLRGINCIRGFPGRGVRVWGARTLSSDIQWRYLNVRRLFNFIEKSIENGTQWVVFEPNNEDLWARVKRDVGAFLTGVWRNGMLFGANPSQAFFVRCDAELNPPEERALGRLVIEIGLCPVMPAEFVIFRISQWTNNGP